jgi:hypothetical protein
MRERARQLTIAGVLAAATLTVAGFILIPTSESASRGGRFCGGIAGIPCPEGFKCVDVPGDGCDPLHGGADCPGVCKKAH